MILNKTLFSLLICVASFSLSYGQQKSTKQFLDSIKTQQAHIHHMALEERQKLRSKYQNSQEDSVKYAKRREDRLVQKRLITQLNDSLNRIGYDSLLMTSHINLDYINLSHGLYDRAPKICLDIIEVNLSHNQITSVDSLINSNSQIKVLNVKNNQIGYLGISKNNTLSVLDLSGNKFERYPKLKKLTKLDTLDMSNNNLGNTNRLKIYKSKNIVALNLANCNLSAFPKKLKRLKNLKKLIISNNQPTSLDGIHKLKRLEELEVSNNIVALDPREICRLKNLKKLSMNKCGIIYIPHEISRLSNLEKLTLAENRIEQLPPEIGQLSKLENVILYKNNLQSLPKAFYGLSNLKELDIYYNQFTSLAPELSQLKGIQKLYLSHNDLNQLPELSNLNELTSLYAHHNKLTSIPDVSSLNKLRLIHLQGNNLVSFPNSILQLKYLKELDISNNLIPEFPLELRDMQQLSYLQIDNNELEQNIQKMEELYESLELLKNKGTTVHSGIQRVMPKEN